jgi:hypothetical protein
VGFATQPREKICREIRKNKKSEPAMSCTAAAAAADDDNDNMLGRKTPRKIYHKHGFPYTLHRATNNFQQC